MKLRTNIVAFADSKAAAAIRNMRRNDAGRTRVVEMTFQDLPYYRHRARIQEIMNSDEFRQNNPLAVRRNPEANVPEYDIVTCSKGYFLDRAARMDPFNTSYFIFLDAGYAHGHNVFPADGVWRPKNLFEHSDQITMIERRRGVEHYRNSRHNLHKLNVAPVNGGFIAGGKRAVKRFQELAQEVMTEWLKKGIADDDQSLAVMVYFKEPALFHLVHGGWHDVFKLFHRKQ